MKVRRISLTLQILLINVVILVVATAVLGTISVKQSASAMDHLIKQRMMDIANTAAAEIDGDILDALEDGDQETEEYASVLEDLAAYRDNTDLEYIYCMEKSGSGFIFTVDADTEEPADWGDEVEVTDALVEAGNGKVRLMMCLIPMSGAIITVHTARCLLPTERWEGLLPWISLPNGMKSS